MGRSSLPPTAFRCDYSYLASAMKLCRFCAEEIQDAAVVCKHCGRTLSSNRQAVVRGIELAMGFGAFCLVALLLYVLLGGAEGWADTSPNSADEHRADSVPLPAPPPPPPHKTSVLDATERRLPPSGHFDVPFVVDDPHLRECTFYGRVQVLDGGSRDVEVYLLDEDAYANWSNGIDPAAVYKTGRIVAKTIKVQMPTGQYHFLISNRFSVFTAKTVQVDDARVVCE